MFNNQCYSTAVLCLIIIILLLLMVGTIEPVLQFRLYLNKPHADDKPGEGSHCTLCKTQYELRKPYKVTMLSAENRLVNKHCVV